MKKYINPTVKVVIIEEEELIAQSLGAHDAQGYGTTGGFVKGQSMWDNANSGDITSSNAWDDEEDW